LTRKITGNISLALAVLVILILAAIGGARAYLSRTSGFMTQDEALYFMSALLSVDSGQFVSTYYTRVLFQLLLFGFSYVLGIRDGLSFLTWGPIIPVFFSSATIVLLRQILKEVGLKESLIALTISSSLLFFVFVLMTGFILSETPALCMTMLGIYLALLSQRKNAVLLTIMSLTSFGLATAFRETFALYGILAMLVPLRIVHKIRRRVSYLLTALMILLVGIAVISRIPKSLAPDFRLLTAILQGYAVGVGYGWSPPLAFLVLSGIATLGFFALRRPAIDKAGLYQTLFLCGFLSQITLLIEYAFAFKAVPMGTQFYSAFIRWSFAGLPGAFLSIGYGCAGIERALSILVSGTASFLNKVRFQRLWAIFIIFIAISALWYVYNGSTTLAYSQSALTEERMVTSGSYKPVASGPSNQSQAQSFIPDPSTRLRSDYKSHPMRLYNYVNDYAEKNPDSKILVVIGDIWAHTVRARVILHGIDNVMIVQPPKDLYSFSAMTSSYDLVLLYGEYYGTYYTQTTSRLPHYYLQILANQTDISVLRILEWQEGYLYRLEGSGTRLGTVSLGSVMLTQWSLVTVHAIAIRQYRNPL